MALHHNFNWTRSSVAKMPKFCSVPGRWVVDFWSPADQTRFRELAASDEQSTLTIERDDSSLSEGLQALVDAYNGLRDKSDQYDSYDSESLKKGTLYGNASLRSFVSELTRIVTQDVDGLSGPYRSLQDIGVSIDGEGRLSFETEAFTEALVVDREGVEALLSATLEEESAESDGET